MTGKRKSKPTTAPVGQILASVVITTYNSPATLELVLIALTRQSLMPAEILIADDGSADSTAAKLRQLAPRLPFPLKHLWQPNTGFRAARSRNNAIHRAAHPVIAFLDQDVLPHHNWLNCLAANCQPGKLCLGHSLDLSQSHSATLAPDTVRAGTFENLHLPAALARLNKLHRKYAFYALLRAVRLGQKNKPKLRSCNFAANRQDLLKVNGFDEEYIGWGQEDDDLGRRLYRAGVKPIVLLNTALVSHIAHPERHDTKWRNGPNVHRYHANRKLTRCSAGLDKHPHPDVILKLDTHPEPHTHRH